MNNFMVSFPTQLDGVQDLVVTAESWMVTDGALVFLDFKGNRLRAFAPGFWVRVSQI